MFNNGGTCNYLLKKFINRLNLMRRQALLEGCLRAGKGGSQNPSNSHQGPTVQA